MDVYGALSEMRKVIKYRSLSTLFIDKMRDELDTDNDRKLFDILKNISTMTLKISDDGAEFVPQLVIDGQRSFGVQDLSEDDYNLLLNIDFSRLPLNLRARLADVLWLQKNDYKAAIIAHKSYYELYNLWFDEENYIESLDMIKRAICISARINATDSHDKYCQTMFEYIIRNDGKDKKFLSISLIEILLNQSYGDLNKLVNILNNSISLSIDNPHKTERLYLLRSKCFNKMKNKESAIQSIIELGEYFVEFAEKILVSEEKGAMRAEWFFQKAIMLFRNNGESSKAENTHKRLVQVQKQIPDLMAVYSIPFNSEKIIGYIDECMDGLNFEESILRISNMVSFYKREDFKKKILQSIKISPFSYMFMRNIINDSGQTIFVLPPLDISNPEADEVKLNMHIQNTMLEYERIT